MFRGSVKAPLLFAALLAGVLPVAANYSSTTVNPGNTFSAGSGWAPPNVTMTDPGAAIGGTATMAATAADVDGTVTSVTIQHSAAGAGSWTDVCTDSSEPYSCSLDTTALAEGLYDFRAIATDNSSNTTTSSVVANRRVDNTPPSVTANDPGSPLRGAVTLSSTSSDSGSGIASVRYETSPAGAGTWSDACTGSTTPFSCSFASGALTDGLYDIRAIATDAAGRTATSSVVASRQFDNTVPTLDLTNPGAYLHGTIALDATASDAGTGVTSVTIQRAPTGAGTWTDVCLDTVAPYGCSLDTTTVTDGIYDLRAIAVDGAGGQATSVVMGRTVDNTAPSVAMTDPGANVRGTINVGATASDATAGVASVKIQRAPAGTTTWTDVCTDTTSPHECSLDTTTLANGLYDLRAIATDAGGLATTSATVANRRVDNTLPTAGLSAPAANLRGTITLSGTATDTGSGVASLRMQRSPAGAGSWVDACVDNTTPYSCTFDTTTVADGLYDFRSLATDNTGNETASTVTTNRRIDNTSPTAVLDDPGANLRATVTLPATAADTGGSGVASVRVQLEYAGTWYDLCTDTSSPYSCSLDTTLVGDGFYDLRAVATDVAGNTTTSALLNRRIDNTIPSSAMTDPGAYLRATVVLVAAATDAGSGIASVRIQRSPANAGTYVDVCTDTTAPYECSLDTTALTSGLYDLRAISTDNAGNTRTSTVVQDRRIDNTAPAATMTDPGANMRATVTLGATSTDTGGSGVASVRIQRSAAGAGIWTDVCTDTTSPYNCSLDTTSVGDGLYDLRAVSTDNAGNVTNSAVVTARRIDNTAPAPAMTNPGALLIGTVTLGGNATDAGSGVASVVFQYKLSSGSTWVDACSDTTSPYSCSFNTAVAADEVYDFRSFVTDSAGNTAASTGHTGIQIDNNGPSVATTDPGANLRETVDVAATATDGAGSGVASVRIQRSPAGAGTWTDICTETAPPYDCSFDTTAVTDGLYDLRSIATDNAGHPVTSAVVANRRVDNTMPAVGMTDPGANLRGAVTLASTNADGGSGVASVRYQYKLPADVAWTDACTGSASPFSCSFNTAAAADGVYDLQAIATDAAGNQTTSALVLARRIDNTAPAASMTDPGALLQGSITLSGGATDGGSGLASLKLQSKLSSAGTWTDACTSATSPLSCSLTTTALADGAYDFRALATDSAGNAGPSTIHASRVVDNNAPSVSVADPGANLRATVDVAAIASDPGTGVTSVRIQRSAAGAGSWTDICTDMGAPYSCSLDTTTLANGLYDFRAIAADGAGFSTTSATVANRRVDNTAPTVTATDPGTPLHGTVTLASTTADTGGSGIASVVYQRSAAGAGTWTNVCTGSTTPFSCSFVTGSVADGLYDLRAIATDAAGNQVASAIVASRRVDNTAPAAGMTDPGANLRGTVTLDGTASDGGSGLASLKLQYKLSADSTWVDHCTSATSPLSCSLTTTALADGLYDFRALSTDVAGNSGTAVHASRRVDNTAPVVTAAVIQKDSGGSGGRIHQGGSYYAYANVTDAGSGVATVTADTSSFDAGVTASALSAGSWTVDGVAYNRRSAVLSANATLTSGVSYAFTITPTDSAGNAATPPGYNVMIDNTAPTGVDVQAENTSGLTVGRAELGDTMTWTFSEAMDPELILGGWTGASTNVVVRLNNTSPETVEVWNASNAAATQLGTVSLARTDYTGSNRTFGLSGTASTMVMSGTTVTVTLGTASGAVTTAGGSGNQMQWTIDGSATDLAGNGMTGTNPLETGTADKEF